MSSMMRSRGSGSSFQYGSWSVCQTKTNPRQKEWMASFFAEHDFLVRNGRNGEIERESAAHIVVAPGTTPNTVVRICLEWMRKNWQENPFTVTWYPLGALIPATLIDFKEKSPLCASCARLFLFPGEVDPQCEAVTGQYTVDFLEKLDIRLNAAILSAYRFDMAKGVAYFYFEGEVKVQRTCAKLYAEDKFLFLDTDKFASIAGNRAYTLGDLLGTSRSVTIYTVTSSSDSFLQAQFDEIGSQLLDEGQQEKDRKTEDKKSLRLCIVNDAGEAVWDETKSGWPVDDGSMRGGFQEDPGRESRVRAGWGSAGFGRSPSANGNGQGE